MKHWMPLCQTSATQLQLHHLYPQKGVLYPRKISRDGQSHCTSCSCPHRSHHRTLVVAISLTARKRALISLPPLPGMKGDKLLNRTVGIRRQRYHDKQKEHKVLRLLFALDLPRREAPEGLYACGLPNECSRATFWQM